MIKTKCPRPMRILLASSMFPPTRTGTSFYSMNLAKAFTDRGHDVAVLTVRTDEPIAESVAFPIYYLPAQRIPLPGFFKHFRLCSLLPWNFRTACRIAQEHRADVIFLVNHYQDIAFPAIFAAKTLGIPLVCSVGTQLQSSIPYRDRTLNVLDRLICGRLVFPHCDRVIAWDKEILRYLREIHGAKVTGRTVIVNFGPNGEGGLTAGLSKDYHLQNQVLGVGAVTEQRDFLPLIRAFAQVTSSFPDVRLKIIGHVYNDAAIRTAQELGIVKRVVFMGEQPHQVVLSEMHDSDAFFVSLSGRYVGLGTATIEAMRSGLPVLANVPPDLLGGKALLTDGLDFLYADCQNPAQIATHLRTLLSDRETRERIGRAGQQFVIEHLNWKLVAEEMEKVLTSLVMGIVGA